MKKTFNLAPDFDQKVQKRQKTATLIFDFFLRPSALEKKYQNTTSYHFLPLRSADPVSEQTTNFQLQTTPVSVPAGLVGYVEFKIFRVLNN